MRRALQPLAGERVAFVGRLERDGSRPGWVGEERTAVLVNVRLASSDEPMTDHTWFVVGKRLAALDAAPGALLRFRATVERYEKGYAGRRDDVVDKPLSWDWRLSRASDWEIT